MSAVGVQVTKEHVRLGSTFVFSYPIDFLNNCQQSRRCHCWKVGTEVKNLCNIGLLDKLVPLVKVGGGMFFGASRSLVQLIHGEFQQGSKEAANAALAVGTWGSQ